ncbi:hypothetical protein LCGC14_1557850, partial [marine sediment metagenome]
MKSKKVCIGLIICLIGISPLILFHIQIIEERKTIMSLYELYRFKALGITSAKIPQNTHLWIETDSAGTIYAVDSADNTDLIKTTDKGDNWATIANRSKTIRALWHDVSNGIIYAIEDDRGVDDITVWKITLSTDTVAVIGADIGDALYEATDIFIRDGNLEIAVLDTDNDRIEMYRWEDPNWTLKASLSYANVDIRFSYGIVIGTDYWFWAASDSGVQWTGRLFKFTGASFFTSLDPIADVKYPASFNQYGMAYDGSNIIYFLWEDTDDNEDYLFSYSITGDSVTQGAIYNIALMLDRNNSGIAPNESEKAFGIANEIVYEITTAEGGVLQLQDVSAIADANITAITDNFFMLTNGKMFEYTNIASDINHLKVTEELGTLSYADMDIKETTLGHFSAGDIIKIYDSDTVLSWRGRVLYPEMVLEGTEVIGKYVILGVDSIFDNIYRKNFTTVRSSDYVLKNIIDNALSRLFSYDDEIDDFSALTFKYDQKSKARKTLKYLAMLERAVLHYKPDGELFFNKYNNLSPSPQIYTATYNFEDDADGAFPSGWTDNSGGSTTATIIASLDGHRKVLQLSDNDGADSAIASNSFSAQPSGTVEFYWSMDDVTDGSYVQFDTVGSRAITLLCGVLGDNFYYYDGVAVNWSAAVLGATDNTWTHHKIIFDIATDTFDWYIDGVLVANDANFHNVQATGITILSLSTNDATSAYNAFFDAVGYSWDPAYTIGDNLNAWTQATSYVKITHYTPAGNRHITRAPVIGANNDLGQVYYVGSASESEEHRFGINELQPWRDPEITNYTEAKQLGDNLQEIYSIDTQMISMLVAKKKHIQVGYTIKLSWNILFNISLANFLVTKRVWYPITDICELELTDNILTTKAFNLKVINSFYDENAQEGYEHPDVPESAADGIVLPLKSIAELRAFDAFASSVGLTLFLHQDASADVAGYKLLDSLFPDDAKT